MTAPVSFGFRWPGGYAGVETRVSTRARRWRVVVHAADRIEVVVPARGRTPAAPDVVEQMRPWLERTLARESRRPVLGLAGGSWLHGEPVGRPLDEQAYRRHARSATHEAIEAVVSAVGRRPARVRIGDPQTRFGSCSSRGIVSFSWRLVLAPRSVLDYVVVHELCHLLHPDHSRRFWDEVARVRPEWKRDADWLRAHGRELLAYEPVG